MARSKVSSTQKALGRPVRIGASQYYCSNRYIRSLTVPVQIHICAKHYRIRGSSMSNFADLARADKFIGQPIGPSNSLKRRAFYGAAVVALLAGGSFFVLHSKTGDAAVPPVQAQPVSAA